MPLPCSKRAPKRHLFQVVGKCVTRLRVCFVCVFSFSPSASALLLWVLTPPSRPLCACRRGGRCGAVPVLLAGGPRVSGVVGQAAGCAAHPRLAVRGGGAPAQGGVPRTRPHTTRRRAHGEAAKDGPAREADDETIPRESLLELTAFEPCAIAPLSTCSMDPCLSCRGRSRAKLSKG
jgi:hypothetical protein